MVIRGWPSNTPHLASHGLDDVGLVREPNVINDQGVTPKGLVVVPCCKQPVYQAVGEAAKNLYGEQFWVDRLLAAWDHHQTLGCDALVIDDVRFPYESKIIQSMGGQVWRIARPSTDNHGDMHPSEIHVDSIKADHVYVNEKKVQELLGWVESKCNNFACHD